MKILVALDGSPCSDAALAEVARRPWPRDSEVRLVSVNAPIDADLLRGASPAIVDEIVKQHRAESSRRLREARGALVQHESRVRVTSTLLDGWPKDAIVAEAERWGADLVVVGSHGYGPVRQFFLGSVSLYVAHHAPCSVEIVRRPAQIEPKTA